MSLAEHAEATGDDQRLSRASQETTQNAGANLRCRDRVQTIVSVVPGQRCIDHGVGLFQTAHDGGIANFAIDVVDRPLCDRDADRALRVGAEDEDMHLRPIVTR